MTDEEKKLQDRPEEYPDWATDDKYDATYDYDNVIQVPTEYKKYGFKYGDQEYPAGNVDNGWRRNTRNWIKYLDEKTEPKPSSLFLPTSILGFEYTWHDDESAEIITIRDINDGTCLAGSTSYPYVQNILINFRNKITPKWTKLVTYPWVEGSGNSGSAVNLTGLKAIYFFVIMDDEGNIDFGFDSDINATNLLAISQFIYFRCIDVITSPSHLSNPHTFTCYPNKYSGAIYGASHYYHNIETDDLDLDLDYSNILLPLNDDRILGYTLETYLKYYTPRDNSQNIIFHIGNADVSSENGSFKITHSYSRTLPADYENSFFLPYRSEMHTQGGPKFYIRIRNANSMEAQFGMNITAIHYK